MLQKTDILLFTFCTTPACLPLTSLPWRENHPICFSSSARAECSPKQPDVHRCWKSLVIRKGNKSLQPRWKASPQHQPNTAWKYPLWSEALSSAKWGQWPRSPFASNDVEMAELMFLYKSSHLWNCIDATETSAAGWNLVFYMLYVKIKSNTGGAHWVWTYFKLNKHRILGKFPLLNAV